MTEATPSLQGGEKAVEQLAKQLRAEGWTVTTAPESDQLPEQLAEFRPDLLAERGDEHLVVEVKSRRLPPDLDTVELAERVANLRGWRLDLVYVPEEPAPADQEQLLRWADEATRLVERAPEAALLLGWAAVEGVLHQAAEARGVDTNQPGRLLVTLASLGVLEDDEYDVLQRALQTRNALAHGRRGPVIDADGVNQLGRLARTLAVRVGAPAA